MNDSSFLPNEVANEIELSRLRGIFENTVLRECPKESWLQYPAYYKDIASLSKKDRIRLYAVMDGSGEDPNARAADDAKVWPNYTAVREYLYHKKGNSGSILKPFYIPDELEKIIPPFEQQEADRLFKRLDIMVTHAIKKAGDKKLQIVVGDIHQDRTALSIMAMLMQICKKHGITDVGLELPPEGHKVYPSGGEIWGLKELKEMSVNNLTQLTIFDEKGTGVCPERYLRNFDFLVHHAMRLGRINLFSLDPPVFEFQDLTHKDMPHSVLTDKFVACMEETLAQKGSCLIFCGIGKLQNLSMQEPENDVERLYVSAAQTIFFSSENAPWPDTFLDPTIFPSDPKRVAEIGAGERDGVSRLVQILTKGNVEAAIDALAIAEIAERRSKIKSIPGGGDTGKDSAVERLKERMKPKFKSIDGGRG